MHLHRRMRYRRRRRLAMTAGLLSLLCVAAVGRGRPKRPPVTAVTAAHAVLHTRPAASKKPRGAQKIGTRPERSQHAQARGLLPSRGGFVRLRAFADYIQSHASRRLSDARAERIARSLLQAADTNGLDPRFFAAMIEQESGFNPHETSSVGARGLGQLTKWEDGGIDPYSIEANLARSARVLKRNIRTFGSRELALAAYNAGVTAVAKYRRIPPFRETRHHVRAVMGIYRRMLATSR